MRKIEITNPAILEALQKKDKMTNELLEMAKVEEAAITKANKLMAKLAKENEKVLPMMTEEQGKVELSEYEEISRVYLDKDKVFIEVADRLEEFKASHKKKKDAANNSSDSNEGDGDSGDNAKESTKGNKDNSGQGQK